MFHKHIPNTLYVSDRIWASAQKLLGSTQKLPNSERWGFMWPTRTLLCPPLFWEPSCSWWNFLSVADVFLEKLRKSDFFFFFFGELSHLFTALRSLPGSWRNSTMSFLAIDAPEMRSAAQPLAVGLGPSSSWQSRLPPLRLGMARLCARTIQS